jgi:hypothetical protein
VAVAAALIALAASLSIWAAAGQNAAAQTANAVRVQPASSNVNVGSNFTVEVRVNNTSPVTALQADILFDHTKVQLQSAAFGPALASALQFTGASANMAAAVTEANGDGSLQGMGIAFISGTLAAGDNVFLTLNFSGVATGNSPINVAGIVSSPAGFTDEDGTATVNPGPTPTPTATPLPPTPTPGPIPRPDEGTPVASGQSVVNGTVQAGAITLNVPAAAVAMTLNRQQTNQAVVTLGVTANTPWELYIRDQKLVNTGHMVSTLGDVLLQSMRAAQGANNVDLANPAGGMLDNGLLNKSGINVTLSQKVEATDPAGAYTITVLFEVFGIF